ncbi:MAG: TetR/AcrR family transcriptional regulator [Actinomycetota bacterium]
MTTRALPVELGDKLAAAAGEFASAFDDVRMDDIARASGIPRATLYYYFAGKDDVLAFLLQSMLDDLRVSVAIAAATEGDPVTRLSAVVRAQLAHLAANPAAGRLLLTNLGRTGRIGLIAAGVDEGFHAPVRSILADGIVRGVLADVDVEIATTALYGAVTIVGLRSLLMDGRIDVDRVADALFPIFSSGLVRQSPLRSPRPKP